MIKSELETGMLVKLADDTIAVVLKECVTHKHEAGGIEVAEFALVDARGDVIYGHWYTNTLEHTRHSSADIVEIRGTEVFNPRCILDLMENKFNQSPLLWKRETAKKMTLEEIEKILGYKVEITN